MVGWLADPTTLDPERFASAFLAQVPADQLGTVFRSIGPGPWVVSDVQASGPGTAGALLSGPEVRIIAFVALDRDDLITQLSFRPVELTDPPSTLAELTGRLAETAERPSYLVADVTDDGTCLPVVALDADRPAPLGSVFKLYVLGAVARAVADGELTWDQPVTIRDELDSLPTGTTQDQPAGTTVEVAKLARRMIEISDNTATDHLIDLVGGDAVEAALAELGHSDPAVTLPFPTTRELFVVKADPDLLARYEAADEAARRELLANEVAAAALPTLDDAWTEPRAVTTVEWFASPLDVCRALVALDDLADRPGLEPVGEILSANPGVPVDPARYDRVLFKGGSEPGVLYAAWLAKRPDGSRVVVTGGLADTAKPIDEATAIQLLALGLDLTG